MSGFCPDGCRSSTGYNTFDEIDALVDMLGRIALDNYRGEYVQIAGTGDYRTAGAGDRLGAAYAALLLSTLPDVQVGSSAQ